jgi:hypothetical protein
MKALRYMLVVTGLGVAGGIVAMHSGDDEPEPPPESALARAPAVPPRLEPAPAAAPVQAPETRIPPMLAAPEEIPGDEGEHGEFNTTTDLVKRKIFKTEPKLAQFDYFREHVLLDSHGRKDYEALLADTAMYEQMRRALLYPADAKDTIESNFKRLMQIDYLREALAWKENPARQQLMATVENIILEDSFGPTMPPDVKRSVAATKMELYEILFDQEPERTQALVEAAKRTRLEKMLEYIAARNQRRVAKERELSLQAQAQQPRSP